MAKLETPEDRERLAVSKKPYWQKLRTGRFLGYRKQPQARRWLVRYKDPNATSATNPYKIEAFANADDPHIVEEGLPCLDYDEAVEAANKIAKAQSAPIAKESIAITVRIVVEEYIKMRDERDAALGRPGRRSDAHLRLGKYVLTTPVVDIPLRKLTKKDLQAWRDSLTGEFTTKRRLINDFKAALNIARDSHDDSLPVGYSDIVKDGLELKARKSGASRASTRTIQLLSDDQFQAVMIASREIDREDGWQGDLQRMIVALAATGMRFSQLARMTVADAVDHDFALLIPASLKGGDAAFEAQPPIKRLIAEADFRILMPWGDNRSDDAPLLARWRSTMVGFDKERGLTLWEKTTRGAWRSASELARPWAKIRERAGLPKSYVPYCFRHTSIVRLLKAGLPASHVAALHNTSEKMLRDHYARYIADALTDLERAHVRGVAA